MFKYTRLCRVKNIRSRKSRGYLDREYLRRAAYTLARETPYQSAISLTAALVDMNASDIRQKSAISIASADGRPRRRFFFAECSLIHLRNAMHSGSVSVAPPSARSFAIALARTS